MSAEFHLIDLISVLSQAEKFGSHITGVPDGDALVSAASDHQVLVEGRVIYRHNLSYMGVNRFG